MGKLEERQTASFHNNKNNRPNSAQALDFSTGNAVLTYIVGWIVAQVLLII
ncbi:MAG: hypothetical protein QG670_1997 [Thermoproteota archaeon]|nr:hypothetical protein [Thermoproteota archaeon]